MLTPIQTRNTRKELQENYRRLAYSEERVCAETGLDREELHRVLEMNRPNPGNVWKLRDYLEDMLKVEGKALYPWTRLADHGANHWYSYDTPWRRKSWTIF